MLLFQASVCPAAQPRKFAISESKLAKAGLLDKRLLGTAQISQLHGEAQVQEPGAESLFAGDVIHPKS